MRRRAVWFKVKQEGRTGTSNTWGDTPLMTAGHAATYTIPNCLKPGYYLVRHEIIALHSAYEYPGAQFYPGCHQLKVSGSGTTTPSSLVAFPGAYKGSDAGITYDAYKGMWYTPGEGLADNFSYYVHCSWSGGFHLLASSLQRGYLMNVYTSLYIFASSCISLSQTGRICPLFLFVPQKLQHRVFTVFCTPGKMPSPA